MVPAGWAATGITGGLEPGEAIGCLVRAGDARLVEIVARETG